MAFQQHSGTLLRGQVLVLVFLDHTLVAGRLERRLRLDEVTRTLIVEGAGGEGAGREGGQVRKVHVVASRLGGLRDTNHQWF